MFYQRVDEQIELRLVEEHQATNLFQLIDGNRAQLRLWHPWVDVIRSPVEMTKLIAFWQLQHTNNRGFYAGIWYSGQLCGVINHVTVDWLNRWTVLSYWLDEAHQGKGIMTASCRAMIQHAFETWKLNRITIECATENIRSRALAERLGFKLEGIIKQIEWLHDRYVDHAMYGLVKGGEEHTTSASGK